MAKIKRPMESRQCEIAAESDGKWYHSARVDTLKDLLLARVSV